MIIKIHNKIEFKDSDSNMRIEGNNGSFEWTFMGNSEESDTFQLTNANKFVYELKHNNNFDVLLQQDIIRCDSVDKITSLHVFCYQSVSVDTFRTPLKFEVYLEDLEIPLGTMSEFSLGNIQNLASDVRICNVQVPEDSKATLVIIIAIKD